MFLRTARRVTQFSKLYQVRVHEANVPPVAITLKIICLPVHSGPLTTPLFFIPCPVRCKAQNIIVARDYRKHYKRKLLTQLTELMNCCGAGSLKHSHYAQPRKQTMHYMKGFIMVCYFLHKIYGACVNVYSVEVAGSNVLAATLQGNYF